MPHLTITLARDPQPMTAKQLAARYRKMVKTWPTLKPEQQAQWAGLKADLELAEWAVGELEKPEPRQLGF